MEVTKAKEFLSGVKSAKEKIKEKERALQVLRMEATGCGAVIGADKVKSSTENKMESLMCIVIDLEEEKKALEKSFENKISKVLKCLASMSKGQYIAVLFYRYICGEKWEQIGDRMHYTARRVCQIHADALKEFAALFEE